MGNCLRGRAAVYWADEDEEEWEWAEAGHRPAKQAEEEGHEQLLGEKPTGATEVKIKITKKQLEELLRKVDAQGLPMQQVLAQLVSGGAPGDADALHDRARHWRPALQSIPEAAE